MSYISTPNSDIIVNGKRVAYREAGIGNSETPLVMLTHLAATLDEWDPKLIDLLAKEHHVVIMDLPGVGASEGTVAPTIPAMAQQAIAIIRALGHSKVNLLGLSMGGMIAQEIVRAENPLVERLILAGTGHRGGKEIDKVTGKTLRFMVKAAIHRADPKRFIFYNHDEHGAQAAASVLNRMAQRKTPHADTKMRVSQFVLQLRAIKRWGTESDNDLTYISQPTLIVNGDNDLQVPTENSRIMHDRISNSRLIIYPNSGHGAIFQNADAFTTEVANFLK